MKKEEINSLSTVTLTFFIFFLFFHFPDIIHSLHCDK